MQIHDIVFQGVFQCSSPTRFELGPDVSEVALPPGMAPEDLQELLIALFYPRWLRAGVVKRMFTGQDVKLAVTFTHHDVSYRLLRRDDVGSVRLQVKEGSGYRDVSAGADVEQAMQAKLGLPPYALFWSLNLWRVQESLPPEQPGFDLNTLDPQLRVLVEAYRIAIEAERVEDAYKGAKARVDEVRRKLGEGIKLEEKLVAAREKYTEISLDGLTADDMELLQTRTQRVEEMDHQITRLHRELGEAQKEVDELYPQRPWLNPVFWGGIAFGVIALIVSVAVTKLRPVAMADTLGFGVAAYLMLQYFAGLEQANVQIARLESIKRRLSQARDEKTALNERYNQLLVHLSVEKPDMLQQRFEKSAKLAEMIQRMEEKLAEVQSPEWHTLREELAGLEAELVGLEAAHQAQPDNVMGVYEMELDLKRLGVDPAKVRVKSADDAYNDGFGSDVFARILEIARRTDQATSAGLDAQALKMWRKICKHVLGERFQSVSLSGGALQVEGLSDSQFDAWQRTKQREVNLVAKALLTALIVNTTERTNALETVLIPDPGLDATTEQRARLLEVFSSAAKRAQIVLVTPVEL